MTYKLHSDAEIIEMLAEKIILTTQYALSERCEKSDYDAIAINAFGIAEAFNNEAKRRRQYERERG